jgi:hypothetical protein
MNDCFLFFSVFFFFNSLPRQMVPGPVHFEISFGSAPDRLPGPHRDVHPGPDRDPGLPRLLRSGPPGFGPGLRCGPGRNRG